MQILCLLCFIATLGSSYQFIEVIKRIDASKAIQDVTTLVMFDLLNAETGQRGYIITGDDDYLTPYSLAIDRTKLDVAKLVKATTSVPAHAPTVKELTALIDDKLVELDRTINVRKKDGLVAAAKEVDQHRGKNLMDDIRVHIDTINLRETTKFIRDESDGIIYGRIAFVSMMLTLLFGSSLLGRRPSAAINH